MPLQQTSQVKIVPSTISISTVAESLPTQSRDLPTVVVQPQEQSKPAGELSSFLPQPPEAVPPAFTSATTNTAKSTMISSGSIITSESKQMLDLINEERYLKKLPPLAFNNDLQIEAQRWADYMATNNYYEHRSKLSLNLLNQDWNSMGENIASEYSVGEAHASLMSSQGHRANILYPMYDKIGIGIYKDYHNMDAAIWVCQIFKQTYVYQ